MEPVDVRAQLAAALRLDLIGPANDSDLAGEVLSQSPSRWYLTGFLVPLEAGESQRIDETAVDSLDSFGADSGRADDSATPEPPSARRAYFPSSIGLSLLVPRDARRLTVVARWGDYEARPAQGGTPRDPLDPPSDILDAPEIAAAAVLAPNWHRTPRQGTVTLTLPAATAHPTEHAVPGSEGLRVVLSVRPVRATGSVEALAPEGTRSVSVFLVNRRLPADNELRDIRFAFQAELEVQSDAPLIPRPDVRGAGGDDWDERVADLQHRDVTEFAVGHNVASHASVEPDGTCRAVRTCWIPGAEVERIAPADIQGVELGMEALATLADGDAATAQLGGFATQYRAWIDDQKAGLADLSPRRLEMAELLLKRAGYAAKRIEDGVAALADPVALEAFRIANRTMAHAARRRAEATSGPGVSTRAPAWRPFQLAYILMNLPGLVDPTHPDREVVDLLFFPTGGGKTEAYLGLSAFALVHRRLKNPGITSAGVTVLMRYTLRLLTLDQLGRAATLICALELERQADPGKFGPWPFEIGLWVGRGATPNRMGAKGDPDPNTARAKTLAFQNDDRKPSPIPLEQCPWCSERFKPTSFQLLPNANAPTDLRVVCVNRRCEFTRNRPLPIVSVDEPIYRRLPCFLIATVDKFAAMPWTGQVGAFFGRVERHDREGFYGPCDPSPGAASLPGPLLPPDLVIQDELHLISGPMGTTVGLYETALDALSTREVGGKTVRPKIIASTATVRRAEDQIRALFNRKTIDVFPPPGPDRRDSFFAQFHRPDQSHPRLYLGIAAQGRSPKVIMLRTYLALLGAAQKAYEAAGGSKSARENPADPYMTLLGYFNSLRELGGSRRIIEDEVNTRLTGYGDRRRVGEREGLFADRRIAYEVVELTSRVSTNRVADAKRRLAQGCRDREWVDVAIATNMISVGLDITRLGLMVVNGQPKTCAEYIQATSRVGRELTKPGLIVTLLNVHRPRDRSHFERFETFHRSFYRTVEATSVTPFSPRSLDRGLAGTLVALARLGHRPMTAPLGAGAIQAERGALDFAIRALADRAEGHARLEPPAAKALRRRVGDRVRDLLDEWSRIAHDYQDQGVALQYNLSESGAARPLLYEFLDPELRVLNARHQKFRANRSMRDVEPSVNLWLRAMDNHEIEAEDES